MFDVLLQIGAAKLVVSAVLAGVAWLVQRWVGHPAVTHPLWLLVLVALLLPAVVAIPVLPGENGAAAVIAEDATLAGELAGGEASAASPEDPEPGTRFPPQVTGNGKVILLIGWLVVAAALLVWTLLRALHFRHWLARTSLPAPQELRDEVSEIGRSLGLARLPEVHTTTARVSPMVCWTGGMIRVVIPSFLLASLDRQELRAVLAHELAHVRRRDHYVRWIEWLACSAFWWNPVAWWARRELRAAEEASCDALGAAAIESTPRAYARSLVGVLEVMSTPPTLPTPAHASGVTSGRRSDSLERRLRILVTGRSSDQAPRWVRMAGHAAAVCLLPVGLVYCSTEFQTESTALEESPELPPLISTELIALVDLNRTDPRAGELPELGDEDPSFSFWIFNTSTGSVGPLPLANAPVIPMACRLDPQEPDESAREGAMRVCAGAMSDRLRQAGDSNHGNVCVAWGSRVGGWRGVCDTWGPIQRDRARGKLTDVPLMEGVRINIRTTQSFAGSKK